MTVLQSSAVEERLELVRSRTSPGVLIFDWHNHLLYSNEEASHFLSTPDQIPAEILQLCGQVKAGLGPGKSGAPEPASCAVLLEGREVHSVRAFPIGGQEGDRPTRHIMVLVERVAEQHGINVKKAKTKFSLSDREVEIAALVAEGLANKDIGCRLFLSEHTVKDHLKNISRKMGAARRSEIVAMLK